MREKCARAEEDARGQGEYFSSLLDEEDKNIVCPTHLIPMKLSEKPNADGRLLATYEYVCLGVDADGRACRHKISLETFPQVSEALRRRDGVGIIRE